MMMMMTDDKNFNLLQVARMYEENINDADATCVIDRRRGVSLSVVYVCDGLV